MKFYNRIEELKELAHFNNKRPSMIVITGRRRIGKTELIKKVEKAIYLFVNPELQEKSMIQEFFNELKKSAVIDEMIKVESWEELISLIFKISEKQSITIAFDEFQRFLKINPNVIFLLQKQWDLNHNKSKIFLIFSGSSVGMISKIFIDSNAPLFKRAQNIIYLKPFDFSIIERILSDFGMDNFEEKISVYSILGGVINYYSLMDFYGVKDLQSIFKELLLRKYAPLKNEVKDIFVEEFGKEHATYYSILMALANSKNTKKEIEDVVDIKGTSLSPYLYNLMEILHIVDYVLPFNETKGSKKGRYVINDPFFKFWFRFIFKNSGFYEKEDFSYINGLIKKDLNSFLGRGFEDFCKEIVEQGAVEIGFEKDIVGKWWSRKGDEIDLVAANNKEKKILFAEFKWQDDVDALKIISELKEKAKLVEWNNGTRKESYAVFAKSFKKKETGMMLFDLKDIEKMVKKWQAR